MTIMLLARVNVWCVLPLLRDSDKRLPTESGILKRDKAGVSDVSKDKSELLGEGDQGDNSEGSQFKQAVRRTY